MPSFKSVMNAVSILSTVQWIVSTVGGLAGTGVVVSLTTALGDAALWQVILGGVSAFVLVVMVMLAIGLAGNARDELTFYIAYREALRKALTRLRRIMEAHGMAYDGPERTAWRKDTIRMIERFRSEDAVLLADSYPGMNHDYGVIETQIARIEKWNIRPARIARGETTERTR